MFNTSAARHNTISMRRRFGTDCHEVGLVMLYYICTCRTSVYYTEHIQCHANTMHGNTRYKTMHVSMYIPYDDIIELSNHCTLQHNIAHRTRAHHSIHHTTPHHTRAHHSTPYHNNYGYYKLQPGMDPA